MSASKRIASTMGLVVIVAGVAGVVGALVGWWLNLVQKLPNCSRGTLQLNLWGLDCET